MENKELVILVAAVIAATASIASILINIYISSKSQRRNRIWENEFERIFELEEKVGILVDDLIYFRCRSKEEKDKFFEMQNYLPNAMGRFRRYPELHEALRLVSHDANWYFGRDMKHGSKEEYEEAKNNLESSYKCFIKACDKILERK
ncbi:hypothetical protein MNBD_GAMMA03-1116 [hydrothermal vent metagenome]|uniref:Uncharacterized protein n=1 Tax=hydrothermal vent metagenome TaxID=652676 RepID=A0A3B0VSS6_9ZZZZ